MNTPNLVESRLEIFPLNSQEAFSRVVRQFPFPFLFESKKVSLFSGRFNLIGIDPVLKITGKKNQYHITSLNDRGELFCSSLAAEDFPLSGTIEKDQHIVEESERTKMKNIAQVIRHVLERFHSPKKTLLGLYGAFTYDFIRLFEDLGDHLPENEISDYTLFLYDTFLFFDLIKEKTQIICYRETEEKAHAACKAMERSLQTYSPLKKTFSVKNPSFTLTKQEFEELVKIGKWNIEQGEFVQVVFSNILKAKFEGDSFALYQTYSDHNPSPYLFYFDLGEDQLVGASPEMMVRYENGVVHLRPIAGTARRGSDPIEDHDLMVELLTSVKERAELEMLIDLGRSDLSRICEPGITIDDYRFVEKYSKVMHTVAHLTGSLKPQFTGLDALISCLNAGTVTGAPKVMAMRTIEQHEKERRGYYGGAVGQLTFSGEVDTAIIIRTAHIRGNELRFQVGAGIVYDSVPEKEHQETLNKAKAFLEIVQ